MYKVEAFPLGRGGGGVSQVKYQIYYSREQEKKKKQASQESETLNGHNSKSLGNSVITGLGRLKFTY